MTQGSRGNSCVGVCVGNNMLSSIYLLVFAHIPPMEAFLFPDFKNIQVKEVLPLAEWVKKQTIKVC